MLGFQQPERGLEIVNFKCSTFGGAIVLTSEVAGTEGWRTQGVFKDVNGASLQKKLYPGLWSTTSLLGSKTDVALSWSPRWGCLDCPSQHRLGLLSCSVFHFTLRFFCFLPACSRPWLSLTSVTWWLSSLSTALSFFLTLLKLLLLTDLSFGTLLPGHLCYLPVKRLAWTHYQFTWPNHFLSCVSCGDTPVPYSRPHWGCCHLGCLFFVTLQYFPLTHCLQNFQMMDLIRISQQALCKGVMLVSKGINMYPNLFWLTSLMGSF